MRGCTAERTTRQDWQLQGAGTMPKPVRRVYLPLKNGVPAVAQPRWEMWTYVALALLAILAALYAWQIVKTPFAIIWLGISLVMALMGLTEKSKPRQYVWPKKK